MLVHSVVFHHHDNPISVVFCAENQKHHCPDHTEQHNCPDTENTHKCCTFQNCLLGAPYTKTDDFKPIKPGFDNFEFIVIISSSNRITPITDLTGLPFRQKPYLPLFYSEFVSQSIGLRAPPACWFFSVFVWIAIFTRFIRWGYFKILFHSCVIAGLTRNLLITESYLSYHPASSAGWQGFETTKSWKS